MKPVVNLGGNPVTSRVGELSGLERSTAANCSILGVSGRAVSVYVV